MLKKTTLDKDNYIVISNSKILLVENESKFWNFFILVALSIGYYFKIIPNWGYISITLIILFFLLIKTVTEIDLTLNIITKKTFFTPYNLTLTKRIITQNLKHQKFISTVINTPPNEGSSMTLYTISIKNLNQKTEEILIQLDNKNGLDLAKKIFEQNGLIVE